MLPSQRTAQAAFALFALTGFLLVFGSTVRVHGAGLACPDWPLCFGEVIPSIDFHVGLEFGHRVVAGIVSLGLMGLIAHLTRTGSMKHHRQVRVLALGAVVALIGQVVLGGLTVLELLAEWTVASHLVTGNTFCALLLVLALTLRDAAASSSSPARAPVERWQRVVVLGVALVVPCQVVLGGLVAGSHAGLACGTWPSCNGAGWFPTFEGLVGLQVLHRVVAYSLLLGVGMNLAAQWSAPGLRRPSLLLAVAVALQATVGVVNVLLQLPVEVTLLHSAGAALTFQCAAWLVFETASAPSARTVAASILGSAQVSNAAGVR